MTPAKTSIHIELDPGAPIREQPQAWVTAPGSHRSAAMRALTLGPRDEAALAVAAAIRVSATAAESLLREQKGNGKSSAYSIGARRLHYAPNIVSQPEIALAGCRWR